VVIGMLPRGPLSHTRDEPLLYVSSFTARGRSCEACMSPKKAAKKSGLLLPASITSYVCSEACFCWLGCPQPQEMRTMTLPDFSARTNRAYLSGARRLENKFHAWW
jgi:hypothetical protein